MGRKLSHVIQGFVLCDFSASCHTFLGLYLHGRVAVDFLGPDMPFQGIGLRIPLNPTESLQKHAGGQIVPSNKKRCCIKHQVHVCVCVSTHGRVYAFTYIENWALCVNN